MRTNDDLWAHAFTGIQHEHGFVPLRVDGAIPADLDGTLWSNGSGSFAHVPRHARMWLDGDGVVSAVRLRGGCAEAAVRPVMTSSARAERAAGKRLFGRYHLRAPLRQHLAELLGAERRNPGNTSVWVHRGRVFALSPAALPVEVDPEDLATMEAESFGGVVSGGFSAHASYSASRRTFYNFGVRFARESHLDLYAFRDERAGAARLASVPLAGPMFTHDFMVTERWAVFLLAPARIAPLPLLLGQPLESAMRWKPEEGSEIVLIGLDAPHAVVRFTTDAWVVFHFANAWEERDEIVLHAPASRDFMRTWRWLEALAKGTSPGRPDPTLHAIRIDPARKRARVERLSDVVSESPRISPRVEMQAHRWVYGSSFSDGHDGIPDRLVKHDVRSGHAAVLDAGPSTFPAEAVFVPRDGARSEDDGWLLSIVFDGERRESQLAVFAADRPSDPPVARAWLGQAIAPPFHGTWTGKGAEVGSGLA